MTKSQFRKGPDFIIIGSMKAGTSSLHAYLDDHPEIHMSQPKEIDYYVKEKKFHKGKNWYDQHFDAKTALSGEASVNYSKCHAYSDVPERIYNDHPNMKFIYVIRDPIERAISHHHHQYTDGHEKNSPEVALQPNAQNHYLLTSAYHHQLQAYLKFFPKKNILLLNAESLKCDHKKELISVTSFLDISEFSKNKSFNKELHTSSEKMMRPGYAKSISQIPGKEILRSLIPDVILAHYKQLTEKTPPKWALSKEFLEKLTTYFRPEIMRLITVFPETENFLGSWKHTYF